MPAKKVASKKVESKKTSSVKSSVEGNTDALVVIATELLSLMGTSALPKVIYNQEDDAFVVTIESSDETGLLIGRKGETLASLQTILGIALKQQTGDWHRVVVNVGDYREKEEDYLKNLANSAAGRVKETGEPQSLYNLKPAQRRIVHMFLSEDKEITTESVGEGDERYLVVTSADAHKN